MYKRPLYKDVSVAEVLTYRRMGMFNSGIAKVLGTTTITVKRMIGSDGRKRGRPPKNGVNRPIDVAIDLWYNNQDNIGGGNQ